MRAKKIRARCPMRIKPNERMENMKFKIMGQKGDSEFDYDSIEMQEIKFDELKGAGMLPTVIDNGKSRMLDKFDPDANEIIWIPRIMGG